MTVTQLLSACHQVFGQSKGPKLVHTRRKTRDLIEQHTAVDKVTGQIDASSHMRRRSGEEVRWQGPVSDGIIGTHRRVKESQKVKKGEADDGCFP